MRGACEDGIYKHAEEGNLAEYAFIKCTNSLVFGEHQE